MNLDKLKKVLMIISISAVATSALMLILQVLGVPIFKEQILLRALLIIATLGVTSGIALIELKVIKRKKILGYIGLALLTLSTLLVLIIFCTNILQNGGIYVRITGITALLSILFIIVISFYSKLGSKLKGLQIPAYACFCSVGLILILLIAGVSVFNIKGMTEIFIILCIASVALFITVGVISARQNSDNFARQEVNGNIETISVSKEVYDNLVAENEKLKQENDELKKKLSELEK